MTQVEVSENTQRASRHTIGYARVSKGDQNLDMQIDALEHFGCDTVYMDKMSGVKVLPELQQALKALRPGDTFAVWSLDRLGRTTLELLKLMEWFNEKEISFVTTTQNIDTRTPLGKLLFTFAAAFAENERDRLIERTNVGLEAARRRGRNGGRRNALSEKQKKEIAAFQEAGTYTVNELIAKYGISRATFYRYFPVGAQEEKEREVG